jgi:2,4-dienoyl-CoA reductase-like NADH-dependent reductase (Old Yellow Enzyme family)
VNSLIQESLKLPCGALLKNRIGKSAMSENMASDNHTANNHFVNLYKRWALGGTGLLITGNVMIDKLALGEPGNVVIEKNHEITFLKEWAEAGKINSTHIWVQLNHPGKQSPKFLSKKPVSPSAISLKPPLNKMFNEPRALEENEIWDIINRFGYAAKVVKETGFTGVQIHGAHGYLVSQFLSPLHNIRKDQWGGSLENRMRFVCEIYKCIRQNVGNDFPVSIKLNSADFQKGGFTEDESIEVVKKLASLGMDLIEVSGGTYEAPEMTGVHRKETTKQREAYFLDYCEKVRKHVDTPLMLTGGFRSQEGMNAALSSKACDLIGIARALAVNPDFSIQIMADKNVQSDVKTLTTGIKFVDNLFPLEITWYALQLQRMGEGKEPNPKLNIHYSILSTLFGMGAKSLKRVRA